MKRASGILLHISSLPSAYGIGDLGPDAYRFADFLQASGQTHWQILPLNPTSMVYGNSPYSSISAFATNILLISPHLMKEQGWLREADFGSEQFSEDKVDYQKVSEYKNRLLDMAYARSQKDQKHQEDYRKFCQDNSSWLEDFALFVVLKEHFGGKNFQEWPVEVRDRHPQALEALKKELHVRLEKVRFLQYVFFNQWMRLKNYCNSKGVSIIGDIPIYVNDDSVEVWTDPGIFKLNENKQPRVVAGVPPDYFSKTGQRWGNPVYNWEELQKTQYAWWLKRLRHNLKLFDVVRIDHFRGLINYWEIPSVEQTAINGQWVNVPYEDFFKTLTSQIPELKLIAEDLGLIPPDIAEIIERLGFPRMKVLIFAFSGDPNVHPYQPRNFTPNCVVYTGTHDNTTVRGWFEHEISPEERQNLVTILGREVSADEVSWALIRLGWESAADTAIVPIQDVLGLGQEARMNVPGNAHGNWQWRLPGQALDSSIQQKLLALTESSERSPKS